MIQIQHGDCMEAMRGMPDKAYDIAIVDPPYGIGGGDYGKGGGKAAGTFERDSIPDYDTARPTAEYFDELRRVSRHQIIWGGNHFADLLPASAAWIVWDKQIVAGMSLSDAELAWCSIGGRVAMYRQMWNGFLRKGERAGQASYAARVHPNQKPVALYKWLLTHYVQDGWRILDTHGGSCSIAIAVHDMAHRNLSLDVWELNALYYGRAVKRLADHQAQLRIAI